MENLDCVKGDKQMPSTQKSKWVKHTKPTKEKGMHEKREQSWASLFGQSDNHRAKRKKAENKKTMTVRDEVKKRDHNRCQFPGCGREATSLHHCIYRSQGGLNDFENLVCLCDNHHTLTKYSPHQNQEWREYWLEWQAENYPEYAERMKDNERIHYIQEA
jgi:hypothetical protein